MAGYSGTPLVKKLGLKDGMAAYTIGAPWDYAAALGLPAPVPELGAAPLPEGAACLHLFTASRAELEARLTEARGRIEPSGVVWVSWPKRASRVATDITEDVIREVALPMGWVDIKVCAVDAVWSGLKLVIRKALR